MDQRGISPNDNFEKLAREGQQLASGSKTITKTKKQHKIENPTIVDLIKDKALVGAN